MARKRDVGELLERALDDAQTAREELRAARGNVRRYKGKAAKTRARNQVAAAERKLSNAERRVNRYANTAAREEIEEETRKRRGAGAPGGGGGGAPGGAAEWEIGFSYTGNRKRGQAVMVNVRISRDDGRPIMRDEVQQVVKLMHEGGSLSRLPQGIHIRGVDWVRGTQWDSEKVRSGDAGNLRDFRNIMATVFASEFRLSPVKDDGEH